MATDVNLTADSVNLGVETQQDAKWWREVVGQIRLADWINFFNVAINDKLDRNICL
jgi:hypothetical protein